MSKYISNEPHQNATLAEAETFVRQRALASLPNLGIVANAQGSQEYVEQADFAANKIDGTSPACLLIRIRKGKDTGEDATVPGHGDYINVGESLFHLQKAPNLMAGVISMIENENNKIGVVFQPGDAQRRISNIPAVAKASAEAFEKAWSAA